MSNLNPAPAGMAPQVTAPDGDATLDPVYMRSQADYHYTMAEAMSLEGRSEKAVEEFKLTLIYDPDSIAVRLRLGQEYVRLGLLSEAVEHVEGAVAQEPTSEPARMMLAGLFSALKMYDQALDQYQQVSAQHPQNGEAPIYIGALLAEQKKTDEAIAQFLKVAKSPHTKEPERAYYYMGRIRAEQGGKENMRSAEKHLSQALKVKPDYTDAVLALASVMKEQDREKAGLKLLESYQEKFGPTREVARVLSRTYLDQEEYEKAYGQLEILEGFERDNLNVRIQLALILIEQKKYAAAIYRLEDILSQAPELDKIRYYLGAVYEEVKSYSAAIQNYQMVPPSSSYFTESVIHTAHIYKTRGKLREATEAVQQAIALRDDIPQFYAYYATLLDDQKEFKSAVTMLKKAVDKFPEHAQLHFFLGSMQDRIGDSKSTITSMKRVLEIDGDHVQALNYLAYTYAEQDLELDAAEDMARRALAMQPNDGYILDTIGWVLFKKGKVENAIRYLEAAYKVKADEAIIAEHLADAYFRQQMLDRARALYRRAAAMETDSRKLQKIQAKLAATEKQMETVQRMPASQSAAPN
ncbi:MAG: tetratricopeptide repeat protein [Bdellovibrionales bacterium]